MRTVVCRWPAVVVLVLAAACLSEDTSPRRDVRPDEIAGEWVMNPASLPGLQNGGYSLPVEPSQHTMTFMDGGSCRFRTFYSAISENGTPNAPVDRECTWQLREVSGKSTLIIRMAGEPSVSAHYDLADEAGRLSLRQPVGDPDAGRYVDYLKR